MTTEISDTEFTGLVLRILLDSYPWSVVGPWDQTHPGSIVLERRYLSDPNDARLCAIRIGGRFQ